MKPLGTRTYYFNAEDKRWLAVHAASTGTKQATIIKKTVKECVASSKRLGELMRASASAPNSEQDSLGVSLDADFLADLEALKTYTDIPASTLVSIIVKGLHYLDIEALEHV